MTGLHYRPLFALDIDLHPTIELGTTPTGQRRIFPVAGGRFAGDRLRGTISPFAGSDLLLVRADGSREQDVRLVLDCDDGAQILMTYRGRGFVTPEGEARLRAGEPVAAADYYLRTAPFFETAAPAHAWLNRIASIGVGERRGTAVHYEVYEIL